MIRQRTRIPRKRSKPRAVHSERTAHITGHKRVRLHGAARDKRRAEVFERAGGRCEELKALTYSRVDGLPEIVVRCSNRATQWSHKRHAANKCDCYSPTAQGACSIASCDECHKKRHNAGGKPCPKKERAHAS